MESPVRTARWIMLDWSRTLEVDVLVVADDGTPLNRSATFAAKDDSDDIRASPDDDPACFNIPMFSVQAAWLVILSRPSTTTNNTFREMLLVITSSCTYCKIGSMVHDLIRCHRFQQRIFGIRHNVRSAYAGWC